MEQSDDYVMLSALQHFVYCPRQFALIHLEQVCAQAMCLEEMLGREVREGALFYAKSKRRLGVEFDAGLRSLVSQTVREIQMLWQNPVMPRPVADARCDDCSLFEACMPHSLRGFGKSFDRDDVFKVD